MQIPTSAPNRKVEHMFGWLNKILGKTSVKQTDKGVEINTGSGYKVEIPKEVLDTVQRATKDVKVTKS